MEGTIKWFNHKKGYGFIIGEDDKEYFVHYTALPRDERVNDNDRVSFNPHESERGLQAQDVKILGKSASDSEQASDDYSEQQDEASATEDSDETSEQGEEVQDEQKEA